MWEDRHGYENKMAQEEEWTATTANTNGAGANSWTTYNINNTTWDEHNSTAATYNNQPTYITTTSLQQPPSQGPPSTQQQQQQQQRPSKTKTPKKDGFSSLFIADNSFPSWDD